MPELVEALASGIRRVICCDGRTTVRTNVRKSIVGKASQRDRRSVFGVFGEKSSIGSIKAVRLSRARRRRKFAAIADVAENRLPCCM